MNDLETRIAAILWQHLLVNGAPPGTIHCLCYEWTPPQQFWHEHVAEVLVSELGLRRDETTYVTMSAGTHHRYTTKWVPDA
jgi:hypothetical protein